MSRWCAENRTLTYNCSSSAFSGILTIRQHWWLFLTSSAQGLVTGLQSKMYKGLYNGHENGNGYGEWKREWNHQGDCKLQAITALVLLVCVLNGVTAGGHWPTLLADSSMYALMTHSDSILRIAGDSWSLKNNVYYLATISLIYSTQSHMIIT